MALNTNNIELLRQTISDYPRLYEWEMSFVKPPEPVKNILTNETFTVLLDTTKLPSRTIGNIELSYKGAKFNVQSRVSTDGTLPLELKEIKGNTPQESWLVRRTMINLAFLQDDFFGDKKNIPNYKTTLQLSMLNNSGDILYAVRYFGAKLNNIAKLDLKNTDDQTYPKCSVEFSYDYWYDIFEDGYGTGQIKE